MRFSGPAPKHSWEWLEGAGKRDLGLYGSFLQTQGPGLSGLNVPQALEVHRPGHRLPRTAGLADRLPSSGREGERARQCVNAASSQTETKLISSSQMRFSRARECAVSLMQRSLCCEPYGRILCLWPFHLVGGMSREYKRTVWLNRKLTMSCYPLAKVCLFVCFLTLENLFRNSKLQFSCLEMDNAPVS